MAGYSAVGSALPWGGRGRGFKSRYSDQTRPIRTINLYGKVLFFYLKFVQYKQNKTQMIKYEAKSSIRDLKVFRLLSLFFYFQKKKGVLYRGTILFKMFTLENAL